MYKNLYSHKIKTFKLKWVELLKLVFIQGNK